MSIDNFLIELSRKLCTSTLGGIEMYQNIRVSVYQVISILLIIIVFSSLCFAASNIFYETEIIVSASRLPVLSRNNTPANVTVIDQKDIAESGEDNLADILKKYEGIIASDSLGGGLEVNIGMRGFGGEGKNVLIVMDGVKISEAFDNSLFWKLIPLENIKKVEIIRGGMSSIYGGGALAGVINITTKKGDDLADKSMLSLLVGGFGEEKYSLSTAEQLGSWGLFLNLGRDKFRGYRDNSGYNGFNTLLNLDRQLSEDKSISLSLHHNNSKSGISGGILKTAYDQNPQQMNESASASDGWDNKFSLFDLGYTDGPVSLKVFTEYRKQNSVMTSVWGTSESSIQTDSAGLVIQHKGVRLINDKRNELITGIEYRSDKIDNPSVFSGATPSRKALDKGMWGAFIQNSLTFNEMVTLTLGGRYDREDFDIIDRDDSSLNKKRRVSYLTPKVGIEYQPLPEFSYYCSFSQSFKAPEGNTLIWETPGLFVANPDINPTIANNYEVGVRTSSAKLALYQIDSKGEILYNAINWKNENYDTVRRGLELSLRKSLTSKIDFSFGYTLSGAFFSSGASKGNRLPLTPENKYNAQIDYSVIDNLGFALDWLQVNGQYALNDFSNQSYMAVYNVLNARLKYNRENISTYCAVRNLLNEKYSPYTSTNGTTVRYNPAPARSLVVGGEVVL